MSISLESLTRESILEPSDSALGSELLAFVLIGASAVLGFVLLSSVAMSLPTGLPQWVVSAVCYGLFVLLTYAAHRRFAFKSSAPHGRALPIYLLVQLTGLGLATVFSWLAYGVLGLPTIVASLMVLGFTSGVNFFVLRSWAFKNVQR